MPMAWPYLTERRMADHIQTLQEALRKFAQMVESKWLFEEASVALDAGRDFKVTITCTETPKGYVVALHRHETERLGSHSFIKLTHGEWEPPIAGVPVLAAGNPSRDQGPCTVCGVPWAKHGTAPTCASHDYTPAGVRVPGKEQQ